MTLLERLVGDEPGEVVRWKCCQEVWSQIPNLV